ncbi:activity-regulated cytoskeleton associated protein 2-like [Rhagoletis pomonella]|uniref:activity-regulated cytoskeleton associated protein 2-like n=1 Tax=Rhagoletis pomonella TaxID=28610 RepID=UPI00177EBFF6|nr:activity-regulated cytoskeleton associated protein 2-like [Rhagoletis pomonella]
MATFSPEGQRDPVAVEKFVAAITVYKDIEKIPDADALRGMPLLLEDYAATWWIGVKESVSTFTDAIELIRATFSPPTPDWKTYLSVFEHKQQVREASDSFICKKRLLFSQLKDSEGVQLNMIYGLLSVKIRERVHRDAFSTFGELLSRCRDAELFLAESNQLPAALSEKAERAEGPKR